MPRYVSQRSVSVHISAYANTCFSVLWSLFIIPSCPPFDRPLPLLWCPSDCDVCFCRKNRLQCCCHGSRRYPSPQVLQLLLPKSEKSSLPAYSVLNLKVLVGGCLGDSVQAAVCAGTVHVANKVHVTRKCFRLERGVVRAAAKVRTVWKKYRPTVSGGVGVVCGWRALHPAAFVCGTLYIFFGVLMFFFSRGWLSAERDERVREVPIVDTPAVRAWICRKERESGHMFFLGSGRRF